MTDPSIADRERLALPVLGRLIVVKGKPLTGCDGGKGNSGEKCEDGNFHFSIVHLPHPRRVSGSIIARERLRAGSSI